MPRKKPISPRKVGRAPKDVSDVLSTGAPESVLLPQRVPSSDIERAVEHVSTSEETGAHGADEGPDVPGFMESPARGAGGNP